MFVQRNTLIFGVTPAVIEFNEGLLVVNDALSELDIQPGVLTKHMKWRVVTLMYPEDNRTGYHY